MSEYALSRRIISPFGWVALAGSQGGRPSARCNGLRVRRCVSLVATLVRTTPAELRAPPQPPLNRLRKHSCRTKASPRPSRRFPCLSACDTTPVRGHMSRLWFLRAVAPVTRPSSSPQDAVLGSGLQAPPNHERCAPDTAGSGSANGQRVVFLPATGACSEPGFSAPAGPGCAPRRVPL
jgi:hypothetical protein